MGSAPPSTPTPGWYVEGQVRGALPVLCLHLSPLLTVRYILWGGRGGGGTIINLSRLVPQMPPSRPAGSGCSGVCGRERGREGRRRRGTKGESGRGLRGKGAERKGPDIFIALPTSFPHPSFHTLFPGNGGQLGEAIRRMGEPSALRNSPLPLVPASSAPPEALGGSGAQWCGDRDSSAC